MRKRSLTLLAVAVAALALVAAAAFGAFTHGSHQSAAGTRIGVHGAWKIVVKNPDGRIVAVRKFHNDLINAGVPRNVLLGTTVAGWWEVGLTNTAGSSNSPCTISGFGANCTLVPTGHAAGGATLFGGHRFDNLTSAASGAALELKGQAFADRAGTIDRVATALFQCPGTIAHSACDDTNWSIGNTFTGTNITPLSVVAGQQILTTVDITFSTA
jgi:hypothetical protein